MLGSLAVTTQLVEEGLLPSAGGTPFELDFPHPVAERPYVGQDYLITSLSLRLIYRLRLGVGQEEAFVQPFNCHLELVRGAETVAIFQLEFQMRKVPGSEGKEWIGEEAVFADLTNPVDYVQGQTLSFRVSGIVPGNVGGPQADKQREREEAALARQAEILQQLVDLEAQAGQIGEANLAELEAILARLFELE